MGPDPQVGRYQIKYIDTPGAGLCGGVPNPLHIASITPVLAYADGTEGKATVVAAPLHDQQLIIANVTGQLKRLPGNVLFPVPPVPFTNHNQDSSPSNTVSYQFTDLDAGDYTVTLTTDDNQLPVSGNFTIGRQATVPRTCDVALVRSQLVVTKPTQGNADGKLEVHTTGGWDTLEVSLWDDVPYANSSIRIRTVRFAASAGVGTLDRLPAGVYNLSARVVGAAPACLFPRDGSLFTVEIPVPDLAIGDQLTFLPWAQPKLLRAATSYGTRPELRLQAELATDGGTPELVPATGNTTELKAEIYGPGDVTGLNLRSILGTTPDPNATDFSPLQLASIEFKEEDLPWRFSLLPPTGSTTPLPWLQLLVLREDEFTALPLTGQPLPSIELPAGFAYPSVADDQRQLWAHVQLNYGFNIESANPQPPTATQLDNFLNRLLPAQPELACSRLFCPRRLAPDTAYHTFLVPTLEVGRRAGLGLAPLTSLPTGTLAIPITPSAVVFPVYFQWQFSTAGRDDFEALVRQLHPTSRTAATATRPGLTVTLAGVTQQLAMPAVLEDAALPTSGAVPSAVTSYLYDKLEPGFTLTPPTTGRPVVAPPLYGRAYMRQAQLTSSNLQGSQSWKYAVNLDPRYRALAALGAQVVRNNQEEYVRRAWEQVRDILLANDKLRGAQAGLRTTAGLRRQHLPLEDAGGRRFQRQARSADEPMYTLADYGLQLAGLALPRLRVSPATAQAAADANSDASSLEGLTLREAIRRSCLPLAAISPTFRRLLRPFGRYQMAEAGRPLRPTQPEGDDTGLQQPGTSLRQRDHLLRELATGKLTAALPNPERRRMYQFEDELLDQLLPQLDGFEQAPLVAGVEAPKGFISRLNEAFAGFKGNDGHYPLLFTNQTVSLPELPLAEVKQDIIAGTRPGPLQQVRLQQAVPQVPVPALPGPLNNDDLPTEDGDESHGPGKPGENEGWRPINPNVSGRSLTVDEAALVEASLPTIKPAKVFPVFKDPMGEPLRRLHPELFVPGLGEFPTGGVAVLNVNHAFIEAYMVGLNHALGSELRWRGFPVDLRATFFQQFWDVSELLNSQLDPDQQPDGAQEAALLDIQPIDQWVGQPLGQNAPTATQPALVPLRLVLRSDLLRRYPTLVIGLQPSIVDADTSLPQPDPEPTHLIYPRQRLPIGQDLVAVTFNVAQGVAGAAPGADGGYYLLLFERPGQPQFGLDAQAPNPAHPDANPVSWNDFSWPYLGTAVEDYVVISPTADKPRATTEPTSLQHLTDSARVAYALFQEPVMAAIPVKQLLS